MVVRAVDIAGRKVGSGFPCFIIAEAGVNHNGSLETALALVDVAAAAAADAVKFQTFQAEKLVSPLAPKAAYQSKATGPASQLEMLKHLELPPAAFGKLLAHCAQRGILFLSTPFDEGSADLLASLAVPAFKTPSGELTNSPFLEHVARKGKPMIVSTGMATLGEVEAAVRAIESAGQHEYVLLHCVSTYPAPPSDTNLRAMQTLEAAFGAPVGYSDHTLGIEVSLAAVALGACVLEKHFTLDRQLAGPDHRSSLEPAELRQFVASVRVVESALGHGRKEPAPSEADAAAASRRSLVAACDIPEQAVLSEEMIAARRPGTGLPPSMRPFLRGRRARKAIAAGTILTLEMIE